MSNLIRLLSRGGPFGHYWVKQTRTTVWWPTSNPSDPPGVDCDVYFGVHPSRTRKSDSQRTIEGDIAAINCLYADVDAKLFSGGKKGAAEHIKTLNPRPTVIVDSGAGYHCYWILREPFALDTPLKEEVAKSLQKRWVTFVGGEKSVHDLARVLRVPGTLNHKYSAPKQVRVVYENPQLLYDIQQLEEALPQLDHRGDDDDEEGILVSEYPPVAKPNDLTYQEIVNLARASSTGSKFLALWKNVDAGYESKSEADLALCCMLAFWTGGDTRKIDTLFRASDRMRDKWERDDYRHTTLLRALAQVTDHYTDPGGLLTAGANDEGNAQCVAARCAGKFLYCTAFGWMEYCGGYWTTELAESGISKMVVQVLKERRAAAARAETTESQQMEAIMKRAAPSAQNVKNCLTLLRPLLDVPTATFDTSYDELNCPNGVLNLKTGELTEASPSKRFSYVIGPDYKPDADSSVWTTWLLDAIGGHQDVLDFLQMAVGYTLTGHTREDALFYIYGPARAGKGVFTETIQALMGHRPLATEVGMETFTAKRSGSDQGHDLASLRVCRFVAASEGKAGQWLNGALIKRWTGGSPITCAHKYQRFFTFQPQFKIWMTSNFKLQMDPDDSASWTRPKVIHFPTSHIGAEDRMLKSRMLTREVQEGILAWAVEGAIKWYQLGEKGLVASERIQEEVTSARAELDWVARWVEEEVEITGDDKDRIPCATYFQRYSDWCTACGAPERKLKALNDSLLRMGHSVRGKPFTINYKTYRGWRGARLLGTSWRESLATMPLTKEEVEDGSGKAEEAD